MNALKLSVCGIALALGMSAAVQAQATIDMSKFTCEQLMRGTANSIEASIWLSGFYNGRRNNTMFDLNKMKQNAEVLVKACVANPSKTVMQTIDELLAPGDKK